MKIWVDADSMNTKIRTIICRACLRKDIPVIFVANAPIPLEIKNKLISQVRVKNQESAADDFIAINCDKGDMAVTRDIPLASRLVEKGLLVLNDRGIVYTAENIRERLSIRDFMKDLRESGIFPEKETRFSEKEIKSFSDSLDRELQKITSVH